ncbi:replication-associated recombination protein A [Candidatus Uhrbacteria bacterium]|nr:replication-associated recombination protein A [Candidatus Uhrbacteria bacterium]
MDLFAHQARLNRAKEAPLPERMRPRSLEEFVGQRALVGEGGVLRELLARGEVPSMILWGPPGTGKTTLARIIAGSIKAHFVQCSAVTSGIAELRTAAAEAERRLGFENRKTILFVDEIHRWNKAQQDACLPHVENGTLTLIGATTENPSFEVNAALLSRTRVFVLTHLDAADIEALLERALVDRERGFGALRAQLEDGVLGAVAEAAAGDARVALNALDLAISLARQRAKKGEPVRVSRDDASKAAARAHLYYDKNREEHYNIISALHKSMRGSDPDAALYWLGRMLEAGEDPLYVARRLVRFASEDVGLADPMALVQATAAFEAAHQLGMPECNVCLAQAAVYLAKAPKSNALYAAYGRVQEDIRRAPTLPVPLHIRNAPTKLMKDLDYGKGYVYPPDAPEAARQEFLPQQLRGKKYLPEV